MIKKTLATFLLVLTFISSTAFATDSYLKEGVTNSPAVRELQTTLQKLGFFFHTVTGNFATLTREAVQAFQKSQGIAQTGIVGPITSSALTAFVSGVPDGGCTINSFTASPTSIAAGASSTLSWSTTGCKTITVDDDAVFTTASGSLVVKPIATTTYTLIATASDGTKTTKSVVVTVTGSTCVINSLTATPLSINAGASSTLSWSTKNCTVTLTNTNTNTVVSTLSSGSVVVYPQTTTTYTLYTNLPLGCTSTLGYSTTTGVPCFTNFPTKSVTVTVIGTIKPTITLTSPNGGETYAPGQTITATWKSTNIPTTDKVQIWVSYEFASAVLSDITVPNTGSATLTLPTTTDITSLGWSQGKNYKISVRHFTTTSVVDAQDLSDGFFTILAPGTCLYEGLDEPVLSVQQPSQFVAGGEGVTHRYTFSAPLHESSYTITELVFRRSDKGISKVLLGNSSATFGTNNIATLSNLSILIPKESITYPIDVNPIYDTAPTNVASGVKTHLDLVGVSYKHCSPEKVEVFGGTTSSTLSTPAPDMVVVRSRPSFTVVQPTAAAVIGNTEAIDVVVSSLDSGTIKLNSLPINLYLNNAKLKTGVNGVIVKDAATGLTIPTTNAAFGTAVSDNTNIPWSGGYTIKFTSGLDIGPGSSKTLKIYVPVSGKKYTGTGTKVMITGGLGIGNGVSWSDISGGATVQQLGTTYINGYPSKDTVFVQSL